jgi:hypothetical protein
MPPLFPSVGAPWDLATSWWLERVVVVELWEWKGQHQRSGLCGFRVQVHCFHPTYTGDYYNSSH